MSEESSYTPQFAGSDVAPDTTTSAADVNSAAPAEADAAPATDQSAADTEQSTSDNASIAAEQKPTAAAIDHAESVHDFLKQQFMEMYGEQSGGSEEAAESAPELKQTSTEDVPAPAEAEAATESAPPDSIEGIKLPGFSGDENALPTDEEVDEKYSRAPKAIREDLKAAYAQVRANNDLTERLGGENFIEPLADMVDAMKTGDNVRFFQGQLQAVGVDGFADFLEDAIKIAVIETQKAEPTNEGEKFLQDRCSQIVNDVLQARFGETATLERISELVKYDAEGYLNVDDVRRYYEDTLGEDNPVIQSLKADKEKLATELEEAKTATAQQQTQAMRQAHDKFSAQITTSTEQMVDKFLLSKSVLRPLDTDTIEIKNGKESLALLINNYVLQSVTGQRDYSMLMNSYAKGEQNTAVYRDRAANLLNTALLAAKPIIANLSASFAAGYSTTRNNTLLNGRSQHSAAAAAAASNGGQPTITSEPKKQTAMTSDEYHQYLVAQLQSM